MNPLQLGTEESRELYLLIFTNTIVPLLAWVVRGGAGPHFLCLDLP